MKNTSKITRYVVAAAVLIVLAGLGYSRWWLTGYYWHGANMNAKVLCSALFVSGRDADEAIAHSVIFDPVQILGPAAPEITPDIDRAAKTVSLHIWAPGSLISLDSKTARYYGDQGCVLDADDGAIHFTPVDVPSTLPPASQIAWPMGDLNAGPTEDQRAALDFDKLDEAIEVLFAREEEHTVAFLALHRGRIIAEHYRHDAAVDMPLESWSMGKSVAATLIGRLIHEGQLTLDEPAPIPAWRGDPKSAVTVRNLLNMSSGIAFDRAFEWQTPIRDHYYGYTAGGDTTAFIDAKPMRHAPNTVRIYRNADPLSLMNILKLKVEAQGGDYLSWPQQELFDKIGARHFVVEPDPYGLFIITGYDYGIARDWARLGLLYLQDGVFEGERLLPEGYAEFVATRAPAWSADSRTYGGLFWTNHNGEFAALPEAAYFMAGGGGQYTWIVPSHDLVMVRQGHRIGGFQDTQNATLTRAHALILEAIAAME